MATSSTTMNWAATITARAIHRRRSARASTAESARLEFIRCPSLSLLSSTIYHNNDRSRYTYSRDLESTSNQGLPAARARRQHGLSAGPARLGVQEGGPGGARGGRVQHVRLQRAGAPRRGRPRDAGDDRRRTADGPQPARRPAGWSG